MAHTGPYFQITSKHSGFDLKYHEVRVNFETKVKLEKSGGKAGKAGKFRIKVRKNLEIGKMKRIDSISKVLHLDFLISS